MDVLSTVLKTVKLEGAMFYNAEFSAPWSFRSPPSCLVAPYLSPEPRHVIIYHLLTQGQAYANVENGPRMELYAGDIVVFPYPTGDVVALQASTGQPVWSESLARTRTASSLAAIN